MITLDTYVMNAIKNHPILYSSGSYKDSKIKVLDQLLNVIGNGVRDNEELKEQLKVDNTEISMSEIEQYVSDEKMYYGYTKMKEYKENGKVIFTSPDLNGISYNGVLESEKSKYPDVIYWMEVTKYEFRPYPNFKEEFSTIYQCSDYLKLHRSFIDGAIEFYEYIKEWFVDNELYYHYAFPCIMEEETNRKLKEIKQCLLKYKSWEEISKAYGVEYNGDLYQFQIDRWSKEKQRIFTFLDKTISLLKTV